VIKALELLKKGFLNLDRKVAWLEKNKANWKKKKKKLEKDL